MVGIIHGNLSTSMPAMEAISGAGTREEGGHPVNIAGSSFIFIPHGFTSFPIHHHHKAPLTIQITIKSIDSRKKIQNPQKPVGTGAAAGCRG
jgi:hypothetical protein